MGLIGTGIVALTIAVWEYRSLVRYLWEKDFKLIAGVDEFSHHTPVVAVSVVLILIGIFAFAVVPCESRKDDGLSEMISEEALALTRGALLASRRRSLS